MLHAPLTQVQQSALVLGTTQLQALSQYWSARAQEVDLRDKAIAQLDLRIQTLEQLVSVRLLHSPSEISDDSSVQLLQDALQHVTVSRQSLMSEQAEWVRALAIAKPRLAAAHVAGLAAF